MLIKQDRLGRSQKEFRLFGTSGKSSENSMCFFVRVDTRVFGTWGGSVVFFLIITPSTGILGRNDDGTSPQFGRHAFLLDRISLGLSNFPFSLTMIRGIYPT